MIGLVMCLLSLQFLPQATGFPASVLSVGRQSFLHHHKFSRQLLHTGRTQGYTAKAQRTEIVRCFGSLQPDESNEISTEDVKYMNLAVSHANEGFGHTFPNPAVGCVLVRQDTSQIVGSGFHPRAGMPHAEVFALFEACGHVGDGVQAAQSVLPYAANNTTKQTAEQLKDTVLQLTQVYTEKGPLELFDKAFEDIPVTAYVTLEPCCHYGKTPPCAASLAAAKVDRVVVGFRDPNPRVDGGGVKLLKEAGVDVDLITREPSQEHVQDVATACAALVDNFVKRITPQDRAWEDYSHINGAKRSALRTLCGRQKTDDILTQVEWPSHGSKVDKKDFDNLENAVDGLPLDPTWMESLDADLWKKELVLVRLNQAVAKKKGAKRLGGRIASELDAHVAQVLGHTVLLYRAGVPPVIDLRKLVEDVKK